MGRRTVEPTTQYAATPATSRKIMRKRKLKVVLKSTTPTATTTTTATHNHRWHENDDEDSLSSNETATAPKLAKTELNKHCNNAAAAAAASCSFHNLSNVTNNSLNTTDSPRPAYTLHPNVVNGTKLKDLTCKRWLLGKPIGKGNFGEIFLASDVTSTPATHENAKFVVKIEPHSNGPLFVEIHCLMNTARRKCIEEQEQQDIPDAIMNIPAEPSGIPDYIASGSHTFADAKYRFLVLPRFDHDLHSLIRHRRVHQRYVLTLAVHIINVLENLHDKGYCHNDVKAQNLMISKCRYYKQNRGKTSTSTLTSTSSRMTIKSINYDKHYEEKVQTTDSGNSSEQDLNYYDEEDDSQDSVLNRSAYERKRGAQLKNDTDDSDEDFDEVATSHSGNSNSMDAYATPVNSRGSKAGRKSVVVPYSGSNPVRSCRRNKNNPIYDEMVRSHYLRPSKRINYTEFFHEDGNSNSNFPKEDNVSIASDAVSEFLPSQKRRSTAKKVKLTAEKRTTRNTEKLPARSISANKTNTTAMRDYSIVEEERIFLIDYGLASKYTDRGEHRPFVMDQRRAHDGTLEFTSRDAHMGAHSRRSDLECLGFNLIFWSQGYLPWKDAASQHQEERVHRAKEHVMTDVREVLRQIYGKQVPKYLGEFLHQVNQLTYDERPQYERYRRIFEREFQQLGFSLKNMQLNSKEITRTCVLLKEELENKRDIFDLQNLNNLALMKNTSVGTPFQENTLSNRVSPKNLRSMSDKKSMKKKKFSWAEVLAQDPDQIARERAQKEFEREEDVDVRPPRRYEGKPTYAILKVMESKNVKEQMNEDEQEVEEQEENDADQNESDFETQMQQQIDELEQDEEAQEEEDEEDEENEQNEDSEIEDHSTNEEDSDEYESDENTSDSETDTTSYTFKARTRRGVTKTNNNKQTNSGKTGKSSNSSNNQTKQKRTTNTNNNKRTLTANNKRNNNSNDNNKNKQKQQRNGHAAGRSNCKTASVVLANDSNAQQRRVGRRTRRCLIKTDQGNEVRIVDNGGSESPLQSLGTVWNAKRRKHF